MSSRILVGDVRERLAELPDASIHCCVTSVPYYGLRDYQTATWEGGDPACAHGVRHWDGPKQTQGAQSGHSAKADTLTRSTCACGAIRRDLQIGLEPTLAEYLATLVEVFREVKRVLRDDGTLWLNIGDSYCSTAPGTMGDPLRQSGILAGVRDETAQARRKYRPETPAGLKPKDLMMVPARLAIALCDDGWWLRSAITWCKGSPMPESVRDRPSSATEMVYLLTKKPTYFYDIEAGRVLANSLNRGYGVEEVGLKVGGSAALRLPTQRRHVSLNDEWAPYLILAALLTTQRVLVKERHDLLGKFFDSFHLPHNRRTGCAALHAVAVSDAAKVAVQVLDHVCVVVAQHDLDRESKLWIRLAAPVSMHAVIGDDGALAVEQSREVMAKVIANAHILRDAISFDALTKRPIDVNVIRQSVPLFQAGGSSTDDSGDGLVTEALLEQFDLTTPGIGLDQGVPVVRHFDSLNGGDYTTDYTTETPANGRNLWNWWVINTAAFPGAHFATFPPKLVEVCIKAGCPVGGTVLDPFLGSGTTLLVADQLGRDGVGIELSPAYARMAEQRIRGASPMFANVERVES